MRRRISASGMMGVRGAGLVAMLAGLACSGGSGSGSEPITIAPGDTGRTTTLDGRLKTGDSLMRQW